MFHKVKLVKNVNLQFVFIKQFNIFITQAGLPGKKLTIALEPEGASIFWFDKIKILQLIEAVENRMYSYKTINEFKINLMYHNAATDFKFEKNDYITCVYFSSYVL